MAPFTSSAVQQVCAAGSLSNMNTVPIGQDGTHCRVCNLKMHGFVCSDRKEMHDMNRLRCKLCASKGELEEHADQQFDLAFLAQPSQGESPWIPRNLAGNYSQASQVATLTQVGTQQSQIASLTQFTQNNHHFKMKES